MGQVGKNTIFFQSLTHALHGIWITFREEKNMKKHVLASILVVLSGILCHCTWMEWLWLLQCIVLVFVTEMINTVIEIVVDVLAKGTYYEWAKKAKDIAAGAVLVSALYALVSACIIFIPKLVNR